MSGQNETKRTNLEIQDLSQKSQDSVPEELNDVQLMALDMLVGGAKFSAIAQKLNIGRTTLYRWRTENTKFQFELSRRRQELREFNVDRFSNLTWLALDRLEAQIRDPYAPISMQAAKAVVTMAKLGQGAGAAAEQVDQKPKLKNHVPLEEG